MPSRDTLHLLLLTQNQNDAEGKTKKSGLQSIIDKLVKKNIIHKNNGARKKAKFVKMMKAVS